MFYLPFLVFYSSWRSFCGCCCCCRCWYIQRGIQAIVTKHFKTRYLFTFVLPMGKNSSISRYIYGVFNIVNIQKSNKIHIVVKKRFFSSCIFGMCFMILKDRCSMLQEQFVNRIFGCRRWWWWNYRFGSFYNILLKICGNKIEANSCNLNVHTANWWQFIIRKPE